MSETFFLTYDVGTTAVKTCLFRYDAIMRLAEAASRDYPLRVLENGGAEQNPEDWWRAMCESTKQVLEKSGIAPEKISGISFCSQMQGVVLVDREGRAVRPAMSYMDQRAERELKEGLKFGLQVAGYNASRLLRSVFITNAVAASVKDPVWKYKWVEHNEPEAFSKIFKWLDVKEFLIQKCTGRFVMTTDSAFSTMLYDMRPGKNCFSREMCSMFGVKMEHLPEIVRSTDNVGGLTECAAQSLGLLKGTPVFGGGGDASLIGVGAGSVKEGSTHIYCGTSGWVSTVVPPKAVVDLNSMIASIVGADPRHYNYFAELDTAGKCLEWVKDHLALDEIDIYLEKKQVNDSYETVHTSLYDYMTHAVENVPPGSHGVFFTPWLHGNRCPFEDPHVRGMFFNIGIETGKTDLIHSVLEGVCYHLRWMLEAQEKKIRVKDTVRFVGGGALSSLTCQILADILNRNVETVAHPQNAGAVGAAIVVAVGLGVIDDLEKAAECIPVVRTYRPDPASRTVYDNGFRIFRQLYYSNKSNFKSVNA